MDELFDLPPTEASPAEPEGRARPRLQRPRRDEVTLRPSDLESLLPADHRARLVWAFVDSLDLSAFHARIRAVEGHSGRPPIDPANLISLWLYATLEGVGSARALDRLCDEHDAYRWLAGGVGVNYHTLAAFRVEQTDILDRLLTESVAALRRRARHHGGRRPGRHARPSLGRGRLVPPTLDARTLPRRGRGPGHRAQGRARRSGATSRRVAAARKRAATERAEWGPPGTRAAARP